MTPLYELRQVTRSANNREILAIDHLILRHGGITGFFGPNGAGKSTLFSLLAFLVPPSSGTMLFRGHDSGDLSLESRRQVTILPQEPRLLKRSVAANLRYGLRLRRQRNNLDRRIREALDLVGLPASFGARKWYQLSGGEIRRVALAARLILRPRVLILDEPTAGVDEPSAIQMREAIFHAREQWATTLLIASHDRDWLEQVADHRITLFQGRIVSHTGINIIPGPWTLKANRIVKQLPDGQQLVLDAPENPERLSVALVEPSALRIELSPTTREGCLQGTITAIRGGTAPTEMLLDILVAGLRFRVSISGKRLRQLALWPGTRVQITFVQERLRWS